MHAQELWEPGTRLIEIGAARGVVGRDLLAAGFTNYLHVTGDEAERDQLAAQYPELVGHTAVAVRRRGVVRQNNADVLLLGPRAALAVWRFRNVRHAGWVAFTECWDARTLAAWLICWLHVLLGRMQRPQRVCAAEHAHASIWAFGVKRRQLPTGARHYVPHGLGIAGFLAQLQGEAIRHAVLRWFDRLPELPPGEDLDVLVDDEQLPRVLALLESGPGIQPCDVYSETGLPRSDFRRMPYFPPRLAKELLDGAIVHNDLCRVPRPLHHLLSLVYHAVYHKGPACGVPESPGERAGAGDHDYPSILAALAHEQQIALEVTRPGLEGFLTEHHWRPPHDMLLRLGKRNRWVRYSVHTELERAEDRGLVTFILRHEAMQRGGLDMLVPALEERGFAILKVKVLTGAELRQVAHNVRGGNWGRGPWPVSGGPPAAVVVAYDPQPLPLSRKQRKKFPLATNARVLEKSLIRDAFNAGRPAHEHCNALHSSDNGLEAWEYIALAMPEAESDIRRRLASWQAPAGDSSSVLKDLTRFGRRTKIELIEYQGRLAVRKSFKLGCERFCRREELAMRALAPRMPQIPPLIEAQDRTIVYPYYDDTLRYERSSGKLLPIAVARDAIAALRQVYEAGYALIDASIDNVLIDRQEGLKLIDFEFLHAYDELPATFAECYDIAGVPDDYSGDIPAGGAKNYRRNWQPYIGLSLTSLLHDPVWLQHVKRTVYVALRPHRYGPRRVRHGFRQLLAALRRRPTQRRPDETHESNSQLRRAA